MLYTKKEIEQIYSNLVAECIDQGARIDFNNNNYLSSEYDNHIDLVTNDGCRVIVYITTNAARRGGFRRHDRGLCEISVSVCRNPKYEHNYSSDETEKHTIYTFYRYKDIYTDNEEQYNVMVAKETERAHREYENQQKECKVKYDVSVILNIVRKRKGFKRTKPEHIKNVEKIGGEYRIWVCNGKKTEVISISRWK